MFDEIARRRLAPLMRPTAVWLGRRGVTPSQVTVASLMVGLGAALATAIGWRWAALGLWLASRVGDGLDGVLARTTGRTSAWGGYLDITCDMAAYSGMVVALGVLRPDLQLAWALVLTGYVLAITTTLALAAAAERSGRIVSRTDRTFQFTAGLAEGGETTVVYVICLMLPAATTVAVWVWVVVLGAAAIQRSRLAWRVLT